MRVDACSPAAHNLQQTHTVPRCSAACRRLQQRHQQPWLTTVGGSGSGRQTAAASGPRQTLDVGSTRAPPCCSAWGLSSQSRALCILCKAGYNPQNVDNPLVVPAPELSAEEVVAAQLDALARNDEPWGNHGIKTAYAFAFDVGGLDPSVYFGRPKDLYHEDHFQGMFSTRLAGLVNNQGFQITGVEEHEGADGSSTVVTVQVQAVAAKQPQVYQWQLRRKNVGARKGCLMTWMVLDRTAAL